MEMGETGRLSDGTEAQSQAKTHEGDTHNHPELAPFLQDASKFESNLPVASYILLVGVEERRESTTRFSLLWLESHSYTVVQ